MHYLSIKCFCIELYNSICYITFDKELFPRFKFLKIVPPCIFYISLIFFFKKKAFSKLRKHLFLRRSFSLVARYSLKFIRCSLLVVKSLVTCCKICSLLVVKNHSLLVAEVGRCKKSLVARCKTRSLLVAEVAFLQKIIRYLSQKLLVAKNHSLLVAEVARC